MKRTIDAERLLHHLRILLAPAGPGKGPIRMEVWNAPKWSPEQREAYEALKPEAWGVDDHGHHWFQVASSLGWVDLEWARAAYKVRYALAQGGDTEPAPSFPEAESAGSSKCPRCQREV